MCFFNNNLYVVNRLFAIDSNYRSYFHDDDDDCEAQGNGKETMEQLVLRDHKIGRKLGSVLLFLYFYLMHDYFYLK